MHKNQEIIMNADTYSPQCQMDTPVRPEHDEEEKMSPSGPIGGSIIAEYGRSMVEMLGTLAIIGVLSVGGIAGYSYGMDKYRANRTMYDVNVRAVDVLAQFDATGDATLDGWKNDKTLYPITLEDETIGIQVNEVPKRVCELMAEGMEKHAKAIKINAEYVAENAGDCGDENTLVFYFDEETATNEPVREQCGEILCEQCQKCDTSTMTCVSVLEGMIPTSLDDLRICVSNGYKSYCGLTGDGCAELGSKNCTGDPECNAYIDGTCMSLDSTEYLAYGLGGFPCTKNGQSGYCMNGICTSSEDTSDCGTYPECYEKYNGQCIPITSQCMAEGLNGAVKCTKNGQQGLCLAGSCDTTIACECSSNSDCDSGEFCETIRSVTWNWSYIQHNHTKCSDPECVEHTVSYTDENGQNITKKIYSCKSMSPVANNHSRVCSFIGKTPLDKDELFVSYKSWWTEEPLIPTALGSAVGEIMDGCWMEDWGYAFYDETTKEFRGGEQGAWDDQGCYLCW